MQNIARAGPKTFDAKKMELISTFIEGFVYLMTRIKEIQNDQLIRTKSGSPLTINLGGKTIVAYRYDVHRWCLKGSIADKELCSKLQCDTKDHCSQALFRDLVGSTYRDAAGNKVKRHGIISEMLKAIFTGYKVGNERKRSMFDVMAELSNMPEKDRKQIIDAVKMAKRILKLVSQLTFVEPEGDVSLLDAKAKLEKAKLEKAKLEQARLEKEKKEKIGKK